MLRNVDMTMFNFKDLGSKFAILSFESYVLACVFLNVILDQKWVTFFFNHASRIKKAKCVIVNTFEELKCYAM